MTKSDNSFNGSEKETTVIVVDFQKKIPIAVFKNESDKVVLAYLHKMDMAPKKLIVQDDLTGDNVLLFPKAA